MEKPKDCDADTRFFEFLNKGKSPHDYERQLLRDHLDRVIEITLGGNPPPYELEIQPSAKCNAHCNHCWGRKLEPLPDKMGTKEIETIAERIKDFDTERFKIDTIKFCGTTGDPLVNSEVTARGIQLFKQLGKKVIVFTNGFGLDNRVNGKLSYQYLANASSIIPSLDAGNEETMLRVKGRKGLDLIIEHLGLLASQGTNIAASYVITEENYQDILEITRKVKDAGVNEIRFRVDFTDLLGIRTHSKEIITKLRQAEELTTPKFKVVSIYSDEGISNTDSEFSSVGKRCFNRYFWACIGPDCNLYACGHTTHKGIQSYGNVLETNLQTLWDSSKAKRDMLPDLNCNICSPSSVRRNEFMNFLITMPPEKIKELYAESIKK